MRNIEELEKLSPDFLEGIAEDGSVPVPSSMPRLAENAVLAASGIERYSSGRRRTGYAVGTVLIALAASLAVILSLPRQPKDTFDDPMLAYAEIEKTFSYITSKMNRGMDLASEAGPVLEKTALVFTTTNN